ncbi:MAG: DUF368 domain-containing protein [Litorivicinus sp.]
MIRTFLKGLLMGAADAVPGVSGGTIAFITGIYDRLIGLIARVGPQLWMRWRQQGVAGLLDAADWRFSVPLVLGIGTGILLVSGLVLQALDAMPALIWSLFLGLVLAAVPIVVREANVRSQWIWGLLGFAGSASVGLFSLALPASTLGVAVGGFIALSAMILPGISGSFLLLVFGLYETVFGAIHALDFSVILPFALGGVVGLASMARLLQVLFTRYPGPVRLCLAGLMLGSAAQLWPFQYADFNTANMFWALLGFCLGGGCLWAVDRLSRD